MLNLEGNFDFLATDRIGNRIWNSPTLTVLTWYKYQKFITRLLKDNHQMQISLPFGVKKKEC
jgi:hypothetical protein